MSKDIWLSQFDPASPIALSDVEPFPEDVRVVSNVLTLVYTDATTKLVGPFRGPPGSQIDTLTLSPNVEIVQTLNDGRTFTSETLRQSLTSEIRFNDGNYGVYTGLVEQQLGNVIPFDTLTAVNGMSVVAQNGTTITANGIWSSDYALIRIFNGTVLAANDGYLWAGSDRRIFITFPKPTLVDTFLFQNMRVDSFGTTTIRVEYLTSSGWLDTGNITLPLPRTAEEIITLPEAIYVTEVRLVVVTGFSVGRFEVYLDKNANPVSSLSVARFSPFLIDRSKFDVVETDTELQLSLMGASEGPIGEISPLNINRYLCLNYLNVDNKQSSAAQEGILLTFNDVVANTLRSELRGPFVKLMPGLYRIRAEVAVDGTGHTTFFLADARHGFPICRPTSTYLGSTGFGTASLVIDTEVYVREETFFCAKVTGAAVSTALHGNRNAANPNQVRNSGILEVWKLEDAVPTLLANPYLDPPVGTSGLMAQYEWLGGLLAGSGDGRGLFDGVYANILTGVGSNYWNAAMHNVVVKVDNDFKIWRRGVTAQPTYNASLVIIRLDDNQDYSHRQLAETAVGGDTWVQWTEILPAGTYRFGADGARLRADSEWFLEAVETSTLNKERPMKLIYTPMSTNAEGNQMASSSSIFGSVAPWYKPWCAFKGTGFAGGTHCWASANTPATVAAPQWLQIEFKDGPRPLDRYVIHNRAGSTAWNPPRDFKLLGRNSPTEDWTVIDTQVDLSSKAIYSKSYFNVSRVNFSIYRLEITRNYPISSSFVAVEFLELLAYVD